MICTKCNIEKEDYQFYKDKRRKNGIKSICKKCIGTVNSKDVQEKTLDPIEEDSKNTTFLIDPEDAEIVERFRIKTNKFL